VRGVCVRATAIAPVVALVRSPVSTTGCEADGGAGMPPFKNTLSKQQIDNAAAYVTTKIAK
jgi:mono/diheme cytochrome c family protein